jgi:hypothetical protein
VTDPRQDFQRSKRFGLVGVGVVAVGSAAIALLFGQGNANPTGVYIALFVLIFGFAGMLFRVQRRDLDQAETRAKLAAVAPVEPVTDPTKADPRSLLAALAVKPIDEAAVAEASDRTWGMARDSISSGAKMMVLIFCAVVPWQLFTFYWSLIVFVPIIVFYALYLLSKVLGPGGSLEPIYADSVPTMEPLGLTLVEAPRVEMHRRPVGPGMESELVGAASYAGERHGRAVTLRLSRETTTTIAGAFDSFEVKAKDQHRHAAASSPATVAAVVDALAASTLWTGVTITGGPAGIVVERKRGTEHWMCDLWLAERLADAAARP